MTAAGEGRGGNTPRTRWRAVLTELGAHAPYSVFSAAFAIVITGVLTGFVVLIDRTALPSTAGSLFHCFHPAHTLLSAAATTAVFRRYEKAFWKAVAVGLAGSIGICGLSDVIMPFLGGRLLGVTMHFHWCVITHPLLVVPFAVVGTLTGVAAADHIPRVSFFSHASHVLVSSVASILYLVSFGLSDWIEHMAAVLIILILAVLVPCCTSDIVLPLALASKGRVNAHGPRPAGTAVSRADR